MIDIKVTSSIGFCSGVQRAIDIASSQKDGCFVLGNIVHNSIVVEQLEKKGIITISDLDEIPSCHSCESRNPKTFLIRAHGLPTTIIKKAKQKGLKIVDATCPNVKRIQKLAKKLYSEGYKVFLLGEKSHPEVLGIVDGNNDITVISLPSQVIVPAKERIPSTPSAIPTKVGIQKCNKIALLSQTTQSPELFAEVEKELRKKFENVKSFNTICKATLERQKSAQELAKKVDLMVVVGDEKSANTRRLVELSSKITKTIQVSSTSDLNKIPIPSHFSEGGVRGIIIGVTSGTSTPMWVIEEIIKEVRNKK